MSGTLIIIDMKDQICHSLKLTIDIKNSTDQEKKWSSESCFYKPDMMLTKFAGLPSLDHCLWFAELAHVSHDHCCSLNMACHPKFMYWNPSFNVMVLRDRKHLKSNSWGFTCHEGMNAVPRRISCCTANLAPLWLLPHHFISYTHTSAFLLKRKLPHMKHHVAPFRSWEDPGLCSCTSRTMN